MKTKKLNFTQYAKYRKRRGFTGCSIAAVSVAVRDGRISCDSAGLIDPRVADEEWGQNSVYRIDRFNGPRYT